MKCCFCGAELEEFGGGDFPLLHYCDNTNCKLYHIMGQYTLWQALIQAKQDLEIATEALKDITIVRCGLEDFEPKAVTMTRIAEKALAQIEHIDDASKKN